MSIIERVRAHGGDIIRTEWRFSLKRGQLTQAAIEWLRKRWFEACAEVWPALGEWAERAAIREFDAGQDRVTAEQDAYAEVVEC